MDWKAVLDSEFDIFEPIELAQQLVRIPSVSGEAGEEEISRFIANYFIDRKITVEWQEVEKSRANVIAEVKGTLGEGPTLLFNGHMDTVPVGSGWTYPPLGGQIVGDKLYGRGACDMKGALAAMMYAAYVVSLFASQLYGSLKLLFVVDEERDNLGIKKWLEDYLESSEVIDFAVVGEPTGLNISLGHRGVAAYRITVEGKASHAGLAEEGINAIYLAASVIKVIEDKNELLKKHVDPDLGYPSLMVGLIEGGISPNVVPERCSFEVDVRTLPDFSLERMEKLLRDIIVEVKNHSNSPFSYQISQTVPHLPPAKVSRDLPAVDVLARSISQIPGEIPIFAPFPASCEASFLFNAGIPTVIFGPGRIVEAHSANEFVSTSQIVTASMIYALLALQFLSGG